MVSLIITCAGKGTRAGFEKNKLLYSVNGETVLSKTLFAFIKSGLIDEYVITVSEEDEKTVSEIVKELPVKIVLGGKTRTESVKNGLKEVKGDIVLIHDGARPFVTQKMIEDCIKTAKTHGSAIPLLPVTDTLIKEEGKRTEYIGKEGFYRVQTPQGFNKDKIVYAYNNSTGEYPDDGSVYSRFFEITAYDGDEKNVKLTYKQDFEKLKEAGEYRFGTGFDCHKLVENRKLILGGITIPHGKGLLGHSDADVLTHAVMDAILSAISERDIGYHFPDTDEKYKNADSMNLLKEVISIAKKDGYKIESVSATVMAEKPKLLKFIPLITENLATALCLPKDKIGIGATTLEGLGFVGREEGICVNATAVLKKAD